MIATDVDIVVGERMFPEWELFVGSPYFHSISDKLLGQSH